MSVPGVGPAFIGYVDNTVNAFRVVRAAMDGVIPRTVRRLTREERVRLVRSGAVFVFSVLESGIKRWTDGINWSPSRIQGNFLIYRELGMTATGRVPPHNARSPTLDDGEVAEIYQPRSDLHPTAPAEPFFKANGLIKKTITITVQGSIYHLVCYYKRGDVSDGVLNTPSTRADMMLLHLSPQDFQLDNLRSPPKVERGPDGRKIIVDKKSTTGSVLDRRSKKLPSEKGCEGPAHEDLQLLLGNQKRPPPAQQRRLRRSEDDQPNIGYSPHRRLTIEPYARIVPQSTTEGSNGHDSTLYGTFDEHHHTTTSTTQLSPSTTSEDSHCTTWRHLYHAHRAPRSIGSLPERHQLRFDRQSPSLRQDDMRQDWVSGVGSKDVEHTVEPAASIGEIHQNRDFRCLSSPWSTGGRTYDEGVRLPGIDGIRSSQPSQPTPLSCEWDGLRPRTRASYAPSRRYTENAHEMQLGTASSSTYDHQFSGWATLQLSTNTGTSPTPSRGNAMSVHHPPIHVSDNTTSKEFLVTAGTRESKSNEGS